MPTLCVTSDGIGPYNAIAKVAMDGVRIALDAGYRVTVVAQRVEESVRREVEWLKLYIPPRGFALQWLTGRHWIKRALGDRRFDVVHAHQPQVADLADVYQCHFLTRVAHERGCLVDRRGLRGIADLLQNTLVLHAEDFFYRRWNQATTMLFDSELTRQEFIRLYGKPLVERALPYACPEPNFATDSERQSAKLRWIGRIPEQPVVGYLGGGQERKGYKRLLRAAETGDGFFILMGGQYSEHVDTQGLSNRVKVVGLVKDTSSFYAACDAFIVPSLFEPLGLVAFEAAARGVPVIATCEVGALPHLLEFGAGVEWSPSADLSPTVRLCVSSREEFRLGAKGLATHVGIKAYGRALLETYEAVIERKLRSGRRSWDCQIA